MISWENYEEYMISYADGELSPEEEQWLLAFVAEHPELRQELSLYQGARLIPDTEEVFAGRASLLKTVPARKIALNSWVRYAVAAGLLLLIGVPVARLLQGNPSAPEVAGKRDTIAAPVAVKTTSIMATPGRKTINEQAIVKESTVERKHGAVRPEQIVQREPSRERLQEAITARSIAPVDVLPVAHGVTISSVARMPEIHTAFSIPDATNALAEEKTEKKTTLWDRLPIDDLKKKQIEHITGGIARAYSEVNAAKQELNDAPVSVKIEKRRIVISF